MRQTVLVYLVVLPGRVSDRRMPLVERTRLMLLASELHHVLVDHHDAGALFALLLRGATLATSLLHVSTGGLPVVASLASSHV